MLRMWLSTIVVPVGSKIDAEAADGQGYQKRTRPGRHCSSANLSEVNQSAVGTLCHRATPQEQHHGPEYI